MTAEVVGAVLFTCNAPLRYGVGHDDPNGNIQVFGVSALLAGFIAGFIWMVITVLIGTFTTAAIIGGAFALLAGTAIVTFLIARGVGRSQKRHTRSATL